MQQINWRRWAQPAAVAVAFIALNILAYSWLTSPAGEELIAAMRGYAVGGAFLVMLIANATIVVPIPWPAILIPIARESPILPVVVAGALGSVIGESLAFFVGRAGRGSVQDTRFYRWVQRQMTHPVRAFAVLFGLSAPFNPVFDVAGITAGAMGVPFWLFFTAVLLARIVRLWIVITFASALGF